MKSNWNSERVDPLFRYESGKDVVYPEVKAWPPILEKLRDKIYEMTGQRCNHCVVNQYRGDKNRFIFFTKFPQRKMSIYYSLSDNNDHIGFHFDKTRDFVSNSSVLTLSFGGERILRLKHNKTKAKEDLHLQSGSLFVLGWKTNTIWKHSIVKTKQKCERRVSLTFRSIKTLKHPDGTMTTIESETENENNKITKRMKKATSVEKNQ